MRPKLMILLAAVALLMGCDQLFPDPDVRPEYCYRWGSTAHGAQAWFCEGHAQYPADTIPDDQKDKYDPPVVTVDSVIWVR
jgi:hypothetical protein